MKKMLMASLFACAALLNVHSSASAAQTKYFNVERISQYTSVAAQKSGQAYFYLAGVTKCDDAASLPYYVIADDAKQAQILSLVTAALLSKKTVTVFYTFRDNNCFVDGVQLYAP